jgi:hypothetical protein
MIHVKVCAAETKGKTSGDRRISHRVSAAASAVPIPKGFRFDGISPRMCAPLCRAPATKSSKLNFYKCSEKFLCTECMSAGDAMAWNAFHACRLPCYWGKNRAACVKHIYKQRDEKASDRVRIGIERRNPFEIIPQVQNTLCPLEIELVALWRVTDCPRKFKVIIQYIFLVTT